MTDAALAQFVTVDDAVAATRREVAALFRLTDRHATAAGVPQGPLDLLPRLTAVATGGVARADGEPEVDLADLAAALTLVQRARADLDNCESALLQAARRRGLTWQQIATTLALGSPQAARQRYERLTRRATD